MVAHVTRGDCGRNVKLVECVLLNVQLLQVWYTDLHLLSRTDVADLHVHDVLAVRIDLSIYSLLSLTDGLFVFFLGLFLLFHHSLNSLVSKLGHKPVNTSFGVNREAKVNFQELFSRIEIFLLKSDTCQAIGDLDVVINMFERHRDMCLWHDVSNNVRISKITSTFFELVAEWLKN